MATTKFKIEIANRMDDMSNQLVCDFSKGTVVALTGHPTLTTPAVALVDHTAANDDFQNAIIAYGTTGNLGSHAQSVTVQNGRDAVEHIVNEQSDYVEQVANTLATYGDAEALILSAGMRVKPPATSTGPLSKVQDLKQVHDDTLPPGGLKIKWKRPLGSEKWHIAGYRIMLAAVITDPYTQIGISTKTSFIYHGTPGRLAYIKVIAFNASGDGAESDVCEVHHQF